jgi:N-acetylglucosamine-6-sulfatase
MGQKLRMLGSLLFLVIFALRAFAANNVKAGVGQSNILLIVLDDLRSNALSVTGHPFSKTPSIDRIANEGLIFFNAFVTHSLCSPSRATLLTGLYSHKHRVVDNNTSLDPRLPTVSKILQTAGYETAFIGKWHMGHNEARPQPGFNRWVSFSGQGVYVDPPLNVDGQDIQATGHMTDILTDHTLEFLARDRQKPFFLVLSHKATHEPYIPQKKFEGLYADTEFAFPATWGENLSNKPFFLQHHLFVGNLEKTARQYYQCLAGVDESIGKILALLEQKNILDNTLIIFTSDNGLFLGEHNLRDKRLAYEESIRVPLLIRYPQWFVAGSNVEDLALNVDIAPTILDAAGIETTFNMQGHSLRKLAYREVKRDCFLYEYSLLSAYPNTPAIRAIRTRDYKYITYLNTNEIPELYDLKNDPLETKNRINDLAFSGVLQRLRVQLDSLRFATGDTSADTSVDERGNIYPLHFELLQNYPNPFNPTTTIKYILRKTAAVRLEIFDQNGRKVATLVNATQSPGLRSVRWNAAGQANGVYFCRLRAGAFLQTQKMIVLQ